MDALMDRIARFPPVRGREYQDSAEKQFAAKTFVGIVGYQERCGR
jgi:hypothetical protein